MLSVFRLLGFSAKELCRKNRRIGCLDSAQVAKQKKTVHNRKLFFDCYFNFIVQERRVESFS